MGYLYPADYNKAIQDVSLQQIISGDRTLLVSAELFAQSEITSHLVQKYDTENEFTNTQAYNPQVNYHAADRVYLDAPAFSSASTYIEGQLCLQGGKVYQCIVAVLVPGVFNPSHWLLLGIQYDLFYANYPHPVFDLKGQYKGGDQVWYKDHIYTALLGTRYFGHDTLIQFGNTNSIPHQNYFPDDPVNGSKAWKDDGEFVIPAGNLLYNLTKSNG
ncbi:hypothetical protein [Paraflavitalea speifideaquila]|uniref:hypothetical protein n=1 Tax=Paraflavitalea speifideaquila TaxID=3076558 RepID=UPI0028E1EE51|nr:hypothetical protein [Paraflavitalea speifideiaquila]